MSTNSSLGGSYQIPAVTPIGRPGSLSTPPIEQKSMMQTSTPPNYEDSSKMGQAAGSPVAGSPSSGTAESPGVFSMTMLPFLIFVILLLIVLLILSWCIYNVSVDSNAKQIESGKKYQAFGLAFLLILAVGAPLGYFLRKMCLDPESNKAMIWAIATIVPLTLLAIMSWVLQWSLGTHYYLAMYAVSSEESRNKELIAIKEALAKKNTTGGQGTNTGTATVPATTGTAAAPANPTDGAASGRTFVGDIRGGRTTRDEFF